MKLSDLGFVPPPGTISIEKIWLDGVRYDLADDGDTLIKSEDQTQDLQLITDLSRR